jgi:hypothetical protein
LFNAAPRPTTGAAGFALNRLRADIAADRHHRDVTTLAPTDVLCGNRGAECPDRHSAAPRYAIIGN